MSWKSSLIVLFLCLVATASAATVSYFDPDPRLVMCDVGQGDALLLTKGSFQMLIDGGPDDAVMACLEKNIPFWDKKLELVIASHNDADHIGGLPGVLAAFTVDEVWISPWSNKTAQFEVFQQALSRKMSQGSRVRVVSTGDTYRVGSFLSIEVLFPQVPKHIQTNSKLISSETQLSAIVNQLQDKADNINNLSINLNMHIQGTTFLTTGDIEQETETALLARGLIHDIDILKIPHHGSKTSTTKPFLDKSQPEIVLISSQKNNKFGHPAPEVIQRLAEIRSKILRTDQLGSVLLRFRGDKIEVEE